MTSFEFIIPEIARQRIPLVVLRVTYAAVLLFLVSHAIVKSRKLLIYFPFVFLSFITLFEAILVLHLFFLTPFWGIVESLYLIPIVMVLIFLWRKNKK